MAPSPSQTEPVSKGKRKRHGKSPRVKPPKRDKSGVATLALEPQLPVGDDGHGTGGTGKADRKDGPAGAGDGSAATGSSGGKKDRATKDGDKKGRDKGNDRGGGKPRS